MEQVRTIPESRIVMISGEINDEVATEVCIELLKAEAEAHGEQITLMINSPGGSVRAGWMICDTIRLIGNVETICIGLCASMAALVLMSGSNRSILPHGRVMLHQPLGGTSLVQAADFEITARELSRTRDDLYSYICNRTGKSLAQVTEDCDRDHWFDATEAVNYGIVDEIVSVDNRSVYPAGNV